ncbi:hypothetical protein GC170_18830 [bacterium]|nr:hypothetical protein [bacterium]
MKNDDSFPKLTILPDTPATNQPRLSNAEKYGSLYWLGISGLIFSLGLVAWFAWSLVAMRSVWQAVYVLHDTSRPTEERLAAARSLLADPRVQPAQIQPMIFRPTLPDKARYLLAEGLDKAVSSADARQMLAVLATKNASSPPNWLRGHLARLAAVTIPGDARFPAEAFRNLLADDDQVVSDWAAFALAVRGAEADKSAGMARLEKRSAEGSPLAKALADAAKAPQEQSLLNKANNAMRIETPATRAILEARD